MTNRKGGATLCGMDNDLKEHQPHDIAHVVEPRADANDASSTAVRNRTVARLSAVGVGGNVALAIFKLVAGLLGNSMALVSDAVHSASDVLATGVAYVGDRIARREADEGHPYGHERFEQLASAILALILAAVGIGIGIAGVQSALAGGPEVAPGILPLVAAAVSIAVKEAMFWYTRHGARAIGSDVFMADAWHHRTDALSSVAALIGVGASRLGFPLGDSIASIAICIFILKVAWDVGRAAIGKLVDESGGAELDKQIAECALSCDGVDHVDSVITRRFGSQFYVDVEVAMDGSIPLHEAHRRAEQVHTRIESECPQVKHATVHVNPT
ncbi:MAG: cation diffusion facilitator family transporter [Eggerthellaceae bacterium]|nr:cation diffusion facilitator family transporter [Eggerthellaceae bacterium]